MEFRDIESNLHEICGGLDQLFAEKDNAAAESRRWAEIARRVESTARVAVRTATQVSAGAVPATSNAAVRLATKGSQSTASIANPADCAWHYSVNGQRSGPVSQVDLVNLLASGNLPVNCYVWHEGLTEWVTAENAGLLPAPASVVPATPEGVSPAAQSAQWYYLVNGQTVGPVTEAELIQIIASSSPDTMVWNPSMAGWEKASALGLTGPRFL